MLQPRYLTAAGLVLLGATIRLLPYVLDRLGLGDVSRVSNMPWNFSPMAAICLFGGAYLADRRWAYGVPLATMLLSDLGIGLLMGDIGFGFHPLIPIVYAAFAVMVWLGGWLRQSRGGLAARVASIGGVALAGELVFFLLTNYANWQFQDAMPLDMPRLYPQTFSGLIACYWAGVEFFGRSLIGTSCYCAALFGGHALLERRAAAPQESAALVDAR